MKPIKPKNVGVKKRTPSNWKKQLFMTTTTTRLLEKEMLWASTTTATTAKSIRLGLLDEGSSTTTSSKIWNELRRELGVKERRGHQKLREDLRDSLRHELDGVALEQIPRCPFSRTTTEEMRRHHTPSSTMTAQQHHRMMMTTTSSSSSPPPPTSSSSSTTTKTTTTRATIQSLRITQSQLRTSSAKTTKR